ncbi:uncharacterized protein Dana_GF18183, isoform B [Drosophila ananassae]|uniref:Uncharacterized protein, isoform B n=1 Tax=Drosophila ananassae TaxID=7217 RepID=A0A0N8P1H4_DROAN|nr:uncharacterized protein LOC6500961 isoform X2 [Drosophila ananassae]KPU79932.1 uncharacterized protein Dana_GF18183, isoform B [Drosophila ananassae]
MALLHQAHCWGLQTIIWIWSVQHTESALIHNIKDPLPLGETFSQCCSAILSVFMTVPCFIGVSYLLLLQTYRLRLEYCLCTLQIALYLTEVWYAIVFVFSLCRPVTYD